MPAYRAALKCDIGIAPWTKHHEKRCAPKSFRWKLWRGAIRAASRFNSPLRGKLVPCKGQLLTQRVNKALRQGSARLRERSRGKRAGERTLERALLGPATPTSVSPHAARWSERATRDRRLGLSALPYQPKFCLLYGRECADQSAGGRALRRLIGALLLVVVLAAPLR